MTEPIIVYSLNGFCLTHTIIIINFEVNEKPYSIYLKIVTEVKDLIKLPISNITSIIDYNKIIAVSARLRDPGSLSNMDGFIKRQVTDQLVGKLILEIFKLIERNALDNEKHLDILNLVSSV